jgi:hypothetical protein
LCAILYKAFPRSPREISQKAENKEERTLSKAVLKVMVGINNGKETKK